MTNHSKDKSISPEQAFAAMIVFLDEYYRRTNGTAALADVLGDIQTLPDDGMPADPAAWQDWLSAIRAVVSERADKETKAVTGAR